MPVWGQIPIRCLLWRELNVHVTSSCPGGANAPRNPCFWCVSTAGSWLYNKKLHLDGVSWDRHDLGEQLTAPSLPCWICPLPHCPLRSWGAGGLSLSGVWGQAGFGCRTYVWLGDSQPTQAILFKCFWFIVPASGITGSMLEMLRLIIKSQYLVKKEKSCLPQKSSVILYAQFLKSLSLLKFITWEH